MWAWQARGGRAGHAVAPTPCARRAGQPFRQRFWIRFEVIASLLWKATEVSPPSARLCQRSWHVAGPLRLRSFWLKIMSISTISAFSCLTWIQTGSSSAHVIMPILHLMPAAQGGWRTRDPRRATISPFLTPPSSLSHIMKASIRCGRTAGSRWQGGHAALVADDPTGDVLRQLANYLHLSQNQGRNYEYS